MGQPLSTKRRQELFYLPFFVLVSRKNRGDVQGPSFLQLNNLHEKYYISIMFAAKIVSVGKNSLV